MSTTALALKPPVDAALEVLGRISKDSTWEDIFYHLEVRQQIERSRQAAEEGRLIDHDEVFAKLLDGEDDEESEE